MIAKISGTVVAKNNQEIIVMMDSLGVTLQVPRPELFSLNEPFPFHVYMHWNQEQGPSLFGFTTELEKTVFLLIIDCAGIGPKIGLAALAHLTPLACIQAIHQGDIKTLSSVSGIGQKKAEHITVSLKHKVSKLIESGVFAHETKSDPFFEQWNAVIQVLQSLNYSRSEIDATMTHLRNDTQHTTSTFDALVRSSLSFLSKNKIHT